MQSNTNHRLRSDIPVPIEQIFAKLMAKNAEDRYQSALGLKYDLELALAQLNTTKTIALFAIASRDRSARFIIPEKLYGRESEIKTLLDAFERVLQGNVELTLIAVFSGIGKTFVVNEVHKPIVRKHSYFIKGKFDQFNRNIPFSAFVQAFRDLMGQLMSESDAQLNLWKTKILKAGGENGQVIMQMPPELERIIGEQPPVTELSGNATQNRFKLLFQKIDLLQNRKYVRFTVLQEVYFHCLCRQVDGFSCCHRNRIPQNPDPTIYREYGQKFSE